jgi:hypothetical protein
MTQKRHKFSQQTSAETDGVLTALTFNTGTKYCVSGLLLNLMTGFELVKYFKCIQ